jgi:FkbM family methyltransferase
MVRLSFNPRAWLFHVHRVLGAFPLAEALAVTIMNQCRAILHASAIEKGTHGPVDTPGNSEAWLIRRIAPWASVFVDVGANRGDWTALFLKYNPSPSRGVLFDPAVWAYDHLLHRFGHHSSLTIVNAACAEAVGEGEFYEEPVGWGSSSLVHESAPTGRLTRVRMTTLDEELPRLGLSSIDVLKIDAEGADLLVLRGAQRLLREQRVALIQFEYNGCWPYTSSTLAAAYQLLESSGYHVFLLKRCELIELNYRRYGEYFAYSNFVAVRPDVLARVLTPGPDARPAEGATS